MSKVNTHVRGHGSTDRHDEWPQVPTRRRTYKLAQKERKVMCGQPLLITAVQRIPFTHCSHLLCLIITYHNNRTVTPHLCVRMWVCESAYMCAAKSLHTKGCDCLCISVLCWWTVRQILKVGINVNVISKLHGLRIVYSTNACICINFCVK